MRTKNPVIAIDFETEYSDTLSLKVQGVVGYTRHPDFVAYLISAYSEDLDEPISFVGPVEDFPWERLKNLKWDLVAHNVSFDQPVFERCIKDGKIPKYAQPENWFCSADLSSYVSGPRTLNGASLLFLDKKMNKETRKKMEGLSLQDAKEQGLEDELLDYAIKDAKYCYELWKKLESLWPEQEREISRINRESGFKGVEIDLEYLRESIQKVERLKWEAEKDIPWDWSHRLTPLAPTAIKEQCLKEGIWIPGSFAQDSEVCAKWEEEFSDKFPWISAIRIWRKSNALSTRLKAIENRLVGSCMPYNILYFGAHTGRFSGGGGYNMQNMLKEGLSGVSPRTCFVPRKGHVMFIADYAQIEARVLLYLANDIRGLEQVRKGISVYEAHARATMNWGGGVLKEENPWLYALAKARVLGLGYGCGWATFQSLASQLTQGEVVLTEAESKSAVHDYRTYNPKVVRFWSLHDDGLFFSASKKDPTHEIELISGRVLTYFNPYIDGRKKLAQVTRGGPYKSFWGGKLTENIVQATARDIMCDAILKLDQEGLCPLFHVHDELVFELEEGKQTEAEKLILQVMSTPPDWAPDLPLGVDSSFTKHYIK